MPNSFTQSKLQDLLQEVPEDIKEWVGSEKITNTIIKLNEKLGLKDDKRRIIPRMLLRLETKDLHPAEFIEEIAHSLDIGMKSANMIAEEIKEKVLEPIEPSLDQWGVNIDLIEPEISESASKTKVEVKKEKSKKGSKEKPVSKLKAQETKEGIEKEGKQIPISSSPKSKRKPETKSEESEEKETIEPKKDLGVDSSDKQTKPESQPFMIHQEKGGDKKDSKEEKTKKRKKKSFSFSEGGFFSSKEGKGEENSPKAQIGTPGAEKDKKKKKGILGFGGKKKEKEERVVHYSDNRTDLSDDGSNKFINLSNLEPSPKNKKERKIKEKPETQEKQNKNINKPGNNSKEKNKSESENDSFLGNIDQSKVNKKDYKDKNNKDDNESGPQVDGNTVDLSQN